MGEESNKPVFLREKRAADRTVRCYLTLRCMSLCPFCSADLKHCPKERQGTTIGADAWAEGLNRRLRPTILAGGEPFLYPHFRKLLQLLKPAFRVEVFTSLQVPVDDCLNGLGRKLSFILSLHPSADLDEWHSRVQTILQAGHGARFHVVQYDGFRDRLKFLEEKGILGKYRSAVQGDQRGQIKSAGKSVNEKHPAVSCKTRCFLFGPDGRRYMCVHDLVRGVNPHEGIANEDGPLWLEKTNCRDFGFCAPCDNAAESIVVDMPQAPAIDIDDIHVRGNRRFVRSDYELLERAVRACHPKTIVEIGAADGCSTMLFGLIAREIGATVLSIEPRPTRRWERNIADLGLGNTVTLIRAASPWLDDDQIPDEIDFLFIDGNHKKRWVLADYHFWAPFVRPGGFIGFHDWASGVWARDVKAAVEIIQETDELEEFGRCGDRQCGTIVFKMVKAADRALIESLR